MTPEQAQQLIDRINLLEKKLNEFYFPDRYQFPRSIRHTGKQLGFYNNPLINQPSTTGTVSVFANSGTALNDHSTSSGYTNSGTYYTFSDVVGALKALGLLKQ